MTSKFKYVAMGVLLGTGIIFLLAMTGATNTDPGKAALTDQVGTYQLAAGNSFYVVLDTRSGKVVEMKGEISQPSANRPVDLSFGDTIKVTLQGGISVDGTVYNK